MDWRLLATTFGAIFIAELGDKTQLATLSLAAGGASRWTVFAGAALALVTTSAVAVLAGEALTRVVSPVVLRRGAGAVFVLIGVLFLLARDEGGEESAQQTATQPLDEDARSDEVP
jgi:Ca2+/H+ antiporter, TMEM165/GDT1 family